MNPACSVESFALSVLKSTVSVIMVRRCCVTKCHSASHDHRGRKINNGLTFHRFPAWRRNEGSQVEELTKRRRMAWVSAVGRANITFHKIPISMRVCSLHFHSGKLIKVHTHTQTAVKWSHFVTRSWDSASNFSNYSQRVDLKICWTDTVAKNATWVHVDRNSWERLMVSFGP